jgi:hypothetical protein
MSTDFDNLSFIWTTNVLSHSVSCGFSLSGFLAFPRSWWEVNPLHRPWGRTRFLKQVSEENRHKCSDPCHKTSRILHWRQKKRGVDRFKIFYGDRVGIRQRPSFARGLRQVSHLQPTPL